ncbi:S41 family peptidase [Fodinibius sp. AD559]|uniref:S41 family peptidase n=1 Tax=Fodinibius sp. AD559 TaxID=3424179 RepID=UPI00404698F6
MKKLRFIWVLLFAVVIGCSDSSPTDPDPGNETNEEASAEKEFVWDAMNYWYYWQGDVTELGDDYFDNDTDFNNYLKDFSDAEALFESLRHPDDDFSFFIDDYEEYQDEQDGIYAALGFNYGFYYRDQERTKLVGYVRYIIPGSPAEDAGLKRLDLFTKVDGTTITVNNYLDLLTNDSAHELTLAKIDTSGGDIEYVDDETVTVESREVIEDPILTTKVVDTSGVKIGYLMYNSFQTNSHQDLNDVFADFKNQGVNELVLDLRYNGGGSVITSQLLSSMISGLGSSTKFGEFSYNEKRAENNNREVYFLDEVPLENEEGDIERDSEGDFVNSESMNSLSLNNVYVLTSSGTASASETVINSLLPHREVIYIGLKTVGKDEGSFTLYDAPAPYLDSDEANPDHKKAIQPIVVKIVNADGEAYPNGFAPDSYDPNISGGCPDDLNDNCVNELTTENLQKKPSLGDPEEPLFSRAIDLITGQQAKRRTDANQVKMKEVSLPSGFDAFKPHRQGMHVEPFMMPTDEK